MRVYLLVLMLFQLTVFNESFTKDIKFIDGYIDQSPKIYYKIFGSGSPTIIILHGGPGIAHDYLVPEWSKLANNFKIIFYDQRGCGFSELCGDSYTWQDHISDLNNLIENLYQNDKVVLAGSSWGSTLALLYNLYFPEDVSALVLSGTVPYSVFEIKTAEYKVDSTNEFYKKFFDELHRKHKAKLEIYKKEGNFIIDSLRLVKSMHPQIVHRILQHPIKRGNNKYAANVTNGSFVHDSPSFDELCNTKIPVLLLRGTENEKPNFDGSNEHSKALENSQIITIKNADQHDPWIDNPEDFINQIINFINDLN